MRGENFPGPIFKEYLKVRLSRIFRQEMVRENIWKPSQKARQSKIKRSEIFYEICVKLFAKLAVDSRYLSSPPLCLKFWNDE